MYVSCDQLWSHKQKVLSPDTFISVKVCISCYRRVTAAQCHQKIFQAYFVSGNIRD